jgi:hypothetical protein
MTVGLSLYQRDRDAQRIGARERMDRLRAFSPDQLAAGLIWLLGCDPRMFDAVLDAVEPCAGDEDLSGGEPEPACGICGEKIGIFLRLGLDWRHYRETRDSSLVGGQGRLSGTGSGRSSCSIRGIPRWSPGACSMRQPRGDDPVTSDYPLTTRCPVGHPAVRAPRGAGGYGRVQFCWISPSQLQIWSCVPFIRITRQVS